MQADALQRADGCADSARMTYGEAARSSSPTEPLASAADSLHVLYLVHDLNDPSVRRRVMMLNAGGARVTLAGFSRKPNPLAGIEGVTPIDLGRTHDGRFAQRVASVGRTAWALRSRLSGVARPDVVLARNLEMLALGRRAVALFGGGLPVAYECLDIHRLMLGSGISAHLLRTAERRLARWAGLLLTSSPAFREHYFDRFGQFDGPSVLLENKVLELGDEVSVPSTGATPPPVAGQPWKIGWFGALRCRRSLDILSAFSRRLQGRFEIVLRGRPAYDQFDDFDRRVSQEPFVTFGGSYRNPEDLGRIYGEVHFSWLIDFFEEGLNSSWLLPNRLYEGCRYSTVPVAMERTETGAFLARRQIGMTLSGDPLASLVDRLSEIDAESYLRAADAVARQSPRAWSADRAECRELVAQLAALAGRA